MGTRVVKATPKAASVTGLSPRQLEPVLFHTGAALTPDGVPPRHLMVADLHRIHRVRALYKSGGQPVTPATEDELVALLEELAGSGAFAREPAAAPTGDEADQESEPEAPADEGAPA